MELDPIDNHTNTLTLDSSERAYKLLGQWLPLNLVFKNPLFLKRPSTSTLQV